MAPDARTSSPGTELDNNPMPQLGSPIKSEDSVSCNPWNSRGRRLFPQRRSSIPTCVSRKMSATPCFPPFEPSPSDDHSPIGHGSRTSSPSSVDSVATVKVRKSPTSERSSPETDFRFGEEALVRIPSLVKSFAISSSTEPKSSPHWSSKKSRMTSFSTTLYADTSARGSFQWKSMAHFHRNGPRLNSIISSQLANGEQVLCDADNSHDSIISHKDAFTGGLPFEIGSCQLSQSPETAAHRVCLPAEVCQDTGRGDYTYVSSKDHSRPDVPVLEMATWDCTVKMFTVATIADNGKLHVHHLALLTAIMPMEVHAEKIGLSLKVSNALRTDHKCSLGLGQSSLLFKEDISNPEIFPHGEKELIIVCNSCDLEKPLNLYFAFTHLSPWYSVAASLPTFRPKEGRSLSEIVFIAEPQPPLSMRTYTRDPLSSWRLCHHPVSQTTCYERIGPPRTYRADFQDEIQMSLVELGTVHFRALGDSTLAEVVWNLDVTIDDLCQGQIGCQMTFLVGVGGPTTLVSLIPHGWTPRYFIVDGCVITEKAGECWKNKDGHITIFKQAPLGPGQIMVETHWQGPPKQSSHDVGSTYNLPLPRITDRKVLGGKLTYPANEAILLNHLGERIRPHGPVEGTYTLLPTMDAGYRILLKRTSEVRTRTRTYRRHTAAIHPSWSLHEDTQISGHTPVSPDSEVKQSDETGMSHAAEKVKEVAAPPKHLLPALFLPLLVLLLLVPGFLHIVERIRKGDHHDEGTSCSDRDQDIFSGDGALTPVILDAAGSDPWRPAVAGMNDAVEVAKCEGWRDWVDYGSGWKGCVP